MRSILRFCAATIAAAGLLVTPVVTAQAQTPSTISEKQLDATAAALKNLSTIRESYEKKLGQAPASDKGRLTDEATNAMKKAVTDQGLSVEEYTTIIEVAQNDPGVRSKLLQRLK